MNAFRVVHTYVPLLILLIDWLLLWRGKKGEIKEPIYCKIARLKRNGVFFFTGPNAGCPRHSTSPR
jgi:hypothetical protein